ncbi:hypothetical protein QBC32DRAFT_337642 [Pseudoneurospora amorphoporcata]|uniref:Uncharacterized protein n=1 Tax=Pseudoneurospora amorphoporcata TaxID=241081 RepID=A0AAN6NXL8_9PEZI|nr:hypothetical protein QBC32DRAFT_337642 [Pseudoneurospora amorphoporcata]
MAPSLSVSKKGITGGSTPNISRVSKSKPSKSKSKSSNDDDEDHRIKTDVLIAIKPTHLANIVSRKKNYEYRKYRLKDEVVRLWLYETKEGGKGRASITHIAVIPEGVRHTPGTVPTEPPGIGNDEFNAGLKQSKFGYPVLEVYELVKPVTLAEMKSNWGMRGAPMGWQYVRAGLWGDRWGEDDERAERVTRVF